VLSKWNKPALAKPCQIMDARQLPGYEVLFCRCAKLNIIMNFCNENLGM